MTMPKIERSLARIVNNFIKGNSFAEPKAKILDTERGLCSLCWSPKNHVIITRERSVSRIDWKPPIEKEHISYLAIGVLAGKRTTMRFTYNLECELKQGGRKVIDYKYLRSGSDKYFFGVPHIKWIK